ncbi:hypothetical protein EJB05_40221, partial [Eragrostis curvula]
MARMVARMEELAALMHKDSGEAPSTLIAGLREASNEGDAVKGLPGATRLLKEMVADAGAVRDSVASLFADYQKAEAEVDVLGDEVEFLVRLLRMTYRALDHYSPVLQHYRGLKEMLCLLGEELPMWNYVP